MISNVPIEDLVTKIRSGVMRLALDHASINSPTGKVIPVSIPIDVELADRRLRCLIRTTDSMRLPDEVIELLQKKVTGPVTVTSDDYLSLDARTSTGITVRLEGIVPIADHSELSAGSGGHTQTFSHSFSKIHFPAKGLDALDTDKVLDALHGTKTDSTSLARSPRKSEPEEECFAIIPGVKLLIRPHGTDSTLVHPFLGKQTSQRSNCFLADLGGGKFCLEDKEGDLYVYFRRPIVASNGKDPSTTEFFEGILTAIGFTHAVHPWPYFRQYRVDHQLRERWVCAPKDCETDGLLPMLEGRMVVSDSHGGLFTSAAEFFARQDERAKSFERALWLLHEGNPPGMAFEVRLLILCSLLEGLVKEHAGGGLGSDPGAWQKAIAKLGLDWSGWFHQVHASWVTYRNKLAHGFDVLPSSSGPREMLNAYSRITAAIYIVMAVQMNFKGSMDISMLENTATTTLI